MNYGLYGKYNPWLFGKAAKSAALFTKAAKPFGKFGKFGKVPYWGVW